MTWFIQSGLGATSDTLPRPSAYIVVATEASCSTHSASEYDFSCANQLNWTTSTSAIHVGGRNQSPSSRDQLCSRHSAQKLAHTTTTNIIAHPQKTLDISSQQRANAPRTAPKQRPSGQLSHPPSQGTPCRLSRFFARPSCAEQSSHLWPTLQVA